MDYKADLVLTMRTLKKWKTSYYWSRKMKYCHNEAEAFYDRLLEKKYFKTLKKIKAKKI